MVDSISFEENFTKRFIEKHVVVRGSCKQQMLGNGVNRDCSKKETCKMLQSPRVLWKSMHGKYQGY